MCLRKKNEGRSFSVVRLVCSRPLDRVYAGLQELLVCVLPANILLLEVLVHELLHHVLESCFHVFFGKARVENKCIILHV